MVLERVRCNAKEDVYEAVIADFREKRLLVTQCVGGDDLGCGIGDLRGDEVLSGDDAADLRQPDPVSGPTGGLDDPFLAASLGGENFLRMSPPVTEGLHHVAEILG